MKFILYFDEKYYKWAPLLIKSIAKYEKEAGVVIFSFNLTESHIKELTSYSNVIEVTNKKLSFDSNIASHWLYQLVCEKGKFILDTMEKYDNDELFINMDVDMILVNNLEELKSDMKNQDVGFVHVSDAKIMSGFLAANNTKNSRIYFSEFYKRATTGKRCHEKDQPVLAKIYNEMKDKMKFVLLDRRYLDHTSNKDAIIWSAHKTDYGIKNERYELYKQLQGKFKIPKKAIEYILLQRSEVDKNNIAETFTNQIKSDFEQILPFLPNPVNVKTILDIGCGIGGINIFMAKYFNNSDIHLLDKTAVEDKIWYGFKNQAAFYNSLEEAKRFICANGINENRIFTHSITNSNSKHRIAVKNPDIITSFKSWGFNFPVS